MPSTMKAVVVIVMTVAGTVVADWAKCNMGSFYKELGCSPEPAGGAGDCPATFSCPDLHSDPTSCHYRNVSYGDGTMLSESVVQNKCSKQCVCRVGQEPRFECAAVDCVDYYDDDSDSGQCVNTYSVDSCCSVGKVCGKDAIAKLKTCVVDGTTYKEGESFQPKEARLDCVCTAAWDGQVVNRSYCAEINCGLELHYQSYLIKKCAPVFIGESRSCPIAFHCQSASTKVVQGADAKVTGPRCQFGNMTLAPGDEVNADESCTKCLCEVPPFVTCTQTRNCGGAGAGPLPPH